MRHVLVTNDFPPKIGGIQSYLWELWRRLPPEEVTVLTSAYPDARTFDAEQSFRIDRTREPVLLPQPALARRVRRLASEVGAEAVVIDPALPLGLLGPFLELPYAVVLHGAEVTVPGRLPPTRPMLAEALRRSSLVISAGSYAAAEARRAAGGRLPPVAEIPPGVDVERFSPLPPIERAASRARLGLPRTGPLVLSVSRLVPRKGMDVLIQASARLGVRYPGLTVAIAGEGRDRPRLERCVRRYGAPVRFLGRVASADLPELYACADVFALCCRNRWRGLEQEGFGVVFLEAAASGVPSVAGDSGGAAEAVRDGETGFVVRDPGDVSAVVAALDRLLGDPELASRQGQAARRRAEREFSYDALAARLQEALEHLVEGAGPRRAGAVPAPTTVRSVEETVGERMLIGGSPEHCYEVLTDFERYPEWAADIKAVSVEQRDEQGRPLRVTFRAAAFGRSTSYTLLYDYSGAPGRLSWVQVAGDLTRRLDGSYELVAADDGGTEITYRLTVDLKVPLPGFVKRRAEGRIMGTALRELKARVEGGGARPVPSA
jgi:phosphatidylinositol alpha-1,6-mannosyltransferase